MPNRMEHAASELMGAVKTAKATIENLHGVFKELSREHGEVEALLVRVRMTHDPAVRAALFPKIREELLSHEKGELAVVYPAFREHEDLASYAEMHQAEAGTLERTITELSRVPYDDAQWGPLFARLAAMVARHAKEEEDEFFSVGSRVLGKQVAEEMKVRYDARKRELARAAAAPKA
jgi:hypothetical protein